MSCETLLCYVPHAITLLLCLAIILTAVNNIAMAKSDKGTTFIKHAVWLVSGFQLMAITVFLINQSAWVFSDNVSLVGSDVAVSWLIYNYLDQLFHITIAIIINTVLRTHIMYNCRLFQEYCGCDPRDGLVGKDL